MTDIRRSPKPPPGKPEDATQQVIDFFDYVKFVWTVRMLNGDPRPNESERIRFVEQITIAEPEQHDKAREVLNEMVEELWSSRKAIHKTQRGALQFFFTTLMFQAHRGDPVLTNDEVDFWFELFGEFFMDDHSAEEGWSFFRDRIRLIWETSSTSSEGTVPAPESGDSRDDGGDGTT